MEMKCRDIIMYEYNCDLIKEENECNEVLLTNFEWLQERKKKLFLKFFFVKLSSHISKYSWEP
jgi:hypothetical protein